MLKGQVTERRARRIASEWHGGKSSPLYALSSTGTVVASLLSEIDKCLNWAKQKETKALISELQALRRYAVQKGANN